MGRRVRIYLFLTLGLIGSALLFRRFGGADGVRLALGNLLLLMVWGVAVMAVTLRRSLRVTLYSYANIGLIAGMLFVSVLCVDLLISLLLSEDAMTMVELYGSLLSFPRKFSYGAAFVIVLISLLLGVSNIALIRHEGFCLNNALSLLVAGFYLGGTAAVYRISSLLDRQIPLGVRTVGALFRRAAPLFLLLMLCYFECVLAGTAVMGWLAARQHPDHDRDYIIILGCSLDRRGGLLPLLKGRVNRAVRYAWEQEFDTGKPVHYVPSGGQGANEIMSEGSAMELYLLSHGAEDYEVFPEKKSVSTYENFLFSKRIIDALKPDAKVAFATTNYHMLRSGILARRAGLDAQGIAGDTKWYFWPNGFVREFFAILTLNIPCHIAVALGAALLCTGVGLIGWYL